MEEGITQTIKINGNNIGDTIEIEIEDGKIIAVKTIE